MPGTMMVGGRYAMTGDALGFLAPLLARGIPLIGRALGIAGRGAGIAATGVTIAGAARSLPVLVGSGRTALATAALARSPGLAARLGGVTGRVGRIGLGGAGLAAVGAGAAGALGMPLPFGGRRRIRRMNVLNPKALKRATRRLAGFAVFATSTQQELKKLVPASARGCRKRKPVCR